MFFYFLNFICEYFIKSVLLSWIVVNWHVSIICSNALVKKLYKLFNKILISSSSIIDQNTKELCKEWIIIQYILCLEKLNISFQF